MQLVVAVDGHFVIVITVRALSMFKRPVGSHTGLYVIIWQLHDQSPVVLHVRQGLRHSPVVRAHDRPRNQSFGCTTGSVTSAATTGGFQSPTGSVMAGHN